MIAFFFWLVLVCLVFVGVVGIGVFLWMSYCSRAVPLCLFTPHRRLPTVWFCVCGGLQLKTRIVEVHKIGKDRRGRCYSLRAS